VYNLQWLTPSIDAQKAAPVAVPVAAAISNAASVTFTGKGAANYGSIQQTNMMRILENFAAPTSPAFPTVGQLWYDSNADRLNVCTSTAPLTWESLAGVSVSATVPASPNLGDLWFQTTGNVTGRLYVFTGVGRHPLVPFDAYASGAYGQVSTLAQPDPGIILNAGSFAAAGSDFGDCYIHGFTGTTATNIPSTISINGLPVSLPNGAMNGGQKVTDGFIVWDQAGVLGTNDFYTCREIGAGVRTPAGQWEYDNGNEWVPFTPVAQQWVIGLVTTAEADDNTAPGVTSATIWREGRDLVSFRAPRAPSVTTLGIGGWEQMWPTVEYHGARREYDAALQLLLNLVGSPDTFGGADILQGLRLTDLATIDASLLQAWLNTTSPAPGTDPAYAATSTYIATEPTSHDWDRLLALAKYAIARLDVPVGYENNIAGIPFVQDGAPPAPDLLALPVSDVRYPPAERFAALRRGGSITASRAFTETMNALAAVTPFRYSLAGVAGTNSVKPVSPAITVSTHSTYPIGFTGGNLSFTMTLRWDTTADVKRFFAGGCAVDVLLDFVLPGAPTGIEVAFNNFIDTFGRLRITQDAVRVFTGTSLALAPIAGGFGASSISPVLPVTLATITDGTHTVSVSGQKVIDAVESTFVITVTFTAPSPITNATSISLEIWRDSTTFDAGVPFFPPPLP
jgi:hypothetical protein